MEKARLVYQFHRYNGESLKAKREIPYELQLHARLVLDELCFVWNKQKLEEELNDSLETGNKEEFLKLSKIYKQFLWE